MFNATDLFKQRLRAHFTLLNRYLRYIFNGHFMIALIFLLVTLAVYYERWIASLDESFPAKLLMALVFGVVASINPLQLFLKEPDKVFLLVKEEQLAPYFRYGIFYNYLVQLYLVFIVAAALYPLYAHTFQTRPFSHFVLLIVLFALIKGWNLVANWYVLHVRKANVHLIDKTIRFILTILFFYSFLQGRFVIITAILLFVSFLNSYRMYRKQIGLHWEKMIENDQTRLSYFYHFVGMFAEVPQLKRRLKKRSFLAKLIQKRQLFKQDKMFDYLYRLTFIRTDDYFSLYVRLTIIGGLLIYFVPQDLLKVSFAILFLYMTNFQLVPLYSYHQTNSWLSLYPVEKNIQVQAFFRLIIPLIAVQAVLFSLLFLLWQDVVYFFATLGLSALFIYAFNTFYVKKKIKH